MKPFIKLSLVIISVLFCLFFSSTIDTKAARFSNHPVYPYKVITIDGEEITLEKYKNNVILIVNVASNCGFTKQYEGLQKLYEKYKDKGFVVLGFPCNQFQGQEPGSNKDIKEFCKTNYGITFPMFSKIEVNEDAAIPLFQYLTGDGDKPIRWNFEKFLINKYGVIIKRFGTKVEPKEIEPLILKLLKSKD